MEPFSYYRYLQRHKGCDIATSSYHKVRPHRRPFSLTIYVVFQSFKGTSKLEPEVSCLSFGSTLEFIFDSLHCPNVPKPTVYTLEQNMLKSVVRNWQFPYIAILSTDNPATDPLPSDSKISQFHQTCTP